MTFILVRVQSAIGMSACRLFVNIIVLQSSVLDYVSVRTCEIN